MEKSFQEIHHILNLMGKQGYAGHVYRGSAAFLPDEETPLSSDATEKLAELAMEYSPETPLYFGVRFQICHKFIVFFPTRDWIRPYPTGNSTRKTSGKIQSKRQ